MACPRKTEVAWFHFVDATRAAIQAHLAQMPEAARALQALPALDERGCDQAQLVLDFFNTRWRDHHQDKERYDGLHFFVGHRRRRACSSASPAAGSWVDRRQLERNRADARERNPQSCGF